MQERLLFAFSLALASLLLTTSSPTGFRPQTLTKVQGVRFVLPLGLGWNLIRVWFIAHLALRVEYVLANPGTWFEELGPSWCYPCRMIMRGLLQANNIYLCKQ